MNIIETRAIKNNKKENSTIKNIPLFSIEKIKYSLEDLDFKNIIFQSSAAVEYFKELSILKDKKVFAMGGGTKETLAKKGTPVIRFPHPIKHNPSAFSFSGLKTAVLQITQSAENYAHADIAASFQHTVANIMAHKIYLALDKFDVKQVILCGGVFANQFIQAVIKKKVQSIDCVVPPLALCTDNAAMIGLAAEEYLTNYSNSCEFVQCNTRLGVNFPRELV